MRIAASVGTGKLEPLKLRSWNFSLAASLACSAFSANAAGAGADHFVTAAMRTDDVHEHISKRLLHSVGMAAAVAHYLRRAIVRRMTYDYVDQLLFACP